MTDKRSQILAAALHLFCENGFQHTSTALISKSAGIATGTLFLYFKSKEELVNTLYIELKQDLGRHIAAVVMPEQDIIELLRQLWFAVHRWALQNPEGFKFLQLFKHSPYVSGGAKQAAAQDYLFIQERSLAAMAAGQLVQTDFGLLTNLFDAFWAANISYLQENSQADAAEIMSRSFAMLLHGIAR